MITGSIYFVHNQCDSVSAICRFIDHANRSGIFFKSVTTNFVCGFDLFCVGIVIMIFDSGQMIGFFHNCIAIVFLIPWWYRYVLVSPLTNLFMSTFEICIIYLSLVNRQSQQQIIITCHIEISFIPKYLKLDKLTLRLAAS